MTPRRRKTEPEKPSPRSGQVPSRPDPTAQLLRDLRTLIDSARLRVAQAANAGLVLLYWRVGKRIREDILGQERAEYGKRVLSSLAQQLTAEYGRGFTNSSLVRMVQFAERFPEEQIVATLSQQLGWSHFVEILPLEDPLKRDFYAEMCRIERWSVRTLRQKIAGMLFERTALSRKTEELIRQELQVLRDEDRLTPDLVFRDPYLLQFLQLTGAYSEKDLESAILRELERFLLELGTDFTFVARQKRLTIGSEDFYLDLLFYHRGLRRLIGVELKLGRFRAADMGQMELYLRWLNKYERRPGEEKPIGLILCSEKDREQIELLELGEEHIRVAEYWTELPPRPLLESKLHDAIHLAREQIAAREARTEEKDAPED